MGRRFLWNVCGPTWSVAFRRSAGSVTIRQEVLETKLMICQGLGAGLMNTLLSQLNQLMCSRNYSIRSSTLTALLNITVGFFGETIFSYFICIYLHKDSRELTNVTDILQKLA